MATNVGYWKDCSAYRSRSNSSEAFTEMLIKMREDNVNLGSVDSCLSLGTGDGLCEVKFIKEFAANISKFIAVDRDHESVVHLTACLEQSLPDVASHVTETDVRSWNGPDDPVDLVLLFHVLYYLSPTERKELFRKIREYWLAGRGFVVVLSSKTLGLSERLGAPMATWTDIEKDMLEAGFITEHVYDIQFVRDYSDPDESLLRFYQHHVHRPFTLDDLCAVIKEMYPEQKADVIHRLAVFKLQ